jgi:hypothetical protein
VDDRLKIKMSNYLPKTVPEISNGGLYHQAVRCGKPNCRCASGYLHEGYYYFIRFVDGRQRKTYVPKKKVETLSKLIRDARAARQAENNIRAGNRELLLDLRQQLRGRDPLIKSLADSSKAYD